MYCNCIKRLIDIILSFIGLIVLSPIYLIVILCIKLDSKGKCVFKQRRIGKNNKEFNILKFRTMKIDTPSECPTHLLENPDFFITRVGKVLRKTSLDELPQLINILKGDMSIIGPRPALWNQYDLIELRTKNNIDKIRPGLTGWAQINGRDELEIEEKVAYDLVYFNKMGILFDIKCFFGTIISVLKKDGIKEGKV